MKNNNLGYNIKLLRENHSLSQIEFAKILNISNTTLSQYEAGNRIPSDEIKLKIADFFNVSVDFLLGRTNKLYVHTNMNISSTNKLEEDNTNFDLETSIDEPIPENKVMRIKELREYHNLTQEQLGKIIGQTKSNISKYENDILEPGIQTIKSLASFFDVSIDYLLGYSDFKKTTTNTKYSESNNINSKISDKNDVSIEAGLSPENIEELKKYAELLKLKQMAEKNKEEISDEISSI